MHRVRCLFVIFTAFCAGLSACSAVAPVSTVSPTSLPTITLTATPPATATPEPTNTPEPSATPDLAKSFETQYSETLSPEQQAVFDAATDMTAEGFTRTFLTEAGLTDYLAYYDKDGEVAYVWNPEQGKPNPAFKVDNNLLINEASSSHIVYNPELDKEESKQTLSDYFKYVRARTCAAGDRVQLGNTLESALSNTAAQRYLEDGCTRTLHYTRYDYGDYPYNVPEEKVYLSAETGVVVKFVNENDIKTPIFKAGLSDGYWGIGINQDEKNSTINITFVNTGTEDLLQYKEYKDMVLSRRIMRSFAHLFGRATTPLAGAIDDTVTLNTIFNGAGLNIKPILIYSKTR